MILHVVAECDCKIYDSNNREIPQIEIVITKEFLKIFPKRNTFILCEKSIINIDSFTKKTWLETLLFERFIRKTEDIKSHLAQNGNDWEDTFYVFLSRNFGF